VGRHIERKGITYLIEAMGLLQDLQAWQLRIPGNGDLTPELQQQAAQQQNVDIQFLGRISDEALASEYAQADLFVLPAIIDSKGDTEGLGVVLVEAIVHGVPVIASSVGGIVDVIRHEQTGILVAPKDSVAIARAMDRLALDQPLRQQVTQGAHAHASQFFCWDKIVQKQISLYRNLLVKRKEA